MYHLIAKPNSDNFIYHYYRGTNWKLHIGRNPKLSVKPDDVVIYEWANDLTARLSRKRLKCTTVVRVHDHEVRKGRIKHVRWENIDYVWFINREIMRQFKEIYPQAKTFFLPNAVDTSLYSENACTEKRIGLLSIYMRPRKRLDRAIKLMRLLPDWELVIRAEPFEGEYPKLRKMAGPNVHFDARNIDLDRYGYEKEDINEFFRDKSVVISTSNHEGFHYAVAEGASCGCMPVVYNWEFGRARDFWAPFVHESLEAMAETIQNYKVSNRWRKYVEDNFHPEMLRTKLYEHIGRGP